MKILALEFSSPVRSVAVGGAVSKQGFAAEVGTRETKPFALIEAALAEAGLGREDIDCIAVGLGPGSYAGIRTAIAIAQGWQMARGVKLLGIASAEAVAAQVIQLGVAGPVFVGLEAQRGELFIAKYVASGFERPRLLHPFQRVSRAEIGGHQLYRMDLLPGVEPVDGDVPFTPGARYLAALAAAGTEFVPGSALEPIYLRPVEFVKAPMPKFAAN
jgi:tRNA threonylcarbamoyl adenosine modification protein YeaZ